MLTDHLTPGDDTSTENAVYFYGDGEPQTPRRLLERLATFDRTLGLHRSQLTNTGAQVL